MFSDEQDDDLPTSGSVVPPHPPGTRGVVLDVGLPYRLTGRSCRAPVLMTLQTWVAGPLSLQLGQAPTNLLGLREIGAFERVQLRDRCVGQLQLKRWHADQSIDWTIAAMCLLPYSGSTKGEIVDTKKQLTFKKVGEIETDGRRRISLARLGLDVSAHERFQVEQGSDGSVRLVPVQSVPTHLVAQMNAALADAAAGRTTSVDFSDDLDD